MPFRPSYASSLAALGLACGAALLAPIARAVGVSDLVLHYDFEHIADPTSPIPDVSAHGNDGKFVDLGNGGGPSTQAKNGTGAYQLSAVQTPDAFTLPSDAFSIAMWFKFPKTDSVPNDIQMLAANSNGGFSTNGFRLYLNDYQTTSGRIILETANGTAGAGMAYQSTTNYQNPPPGTTVNPPNDGQYHLLVMTYTSDDPSLNDEPHAFTWYDGFYMADGHPSNAGSLQPDFQKAGPIRFGGTLDGAFAPAGVQIDDVQIYHGVLSQADMARIITPPMLLAGDANEDGTVNSDDFTILAKNFNASGRAFETGDFNGDGIVNAMDFNALATNFGQTNFTAAPLGAALVPEPVSLAALAGILLLAARRRPRLA